jgi:hypothetical protein
MYFQTPLILMLHRNTERGAESNNYNVAAYRIPTDVFQQLGFCEIPTYFIVATSHTLLLLMYFQTPLILMLHRNTERGAESNNYNVAAYRIPTDVFQQLGFCEIPTYFIVATSHTLLLLMYFQTPLILMLHRNTKECGV